jgi:hypothetical protein
MVNAGFMGTARVTSENDSAERGRTGRGDTPPHDLEFFSNKNGPGRRIRTDP